MARPSAVVERRREILEATCACVAERGFRDLRIVDVARAAGYSTGTVHYYFDSKEALLTEAFRFQQEQSLERRNNLIDPADDPVTRLRTLARGYLPTTQESVRAWRVWVELWVSALGDSSLSSLNDTYYGAWRRTVLTAVQEGKAQGLLRVGDPAMFADVFVGMLDGLAIQVLIGSQDMTAERMRETCEEFLDGVTVG